MQIEVNKQSYPAKLNIEMIDKLQPGIDFDKVYTSMLNGHSTEIDHLGVVFAALRSNGFEGTFSDIVASGVELRDTAMTILQDAGCGYIETTEG